MRLLREANFHVVDRSHWSAWADVFYPPFFATHNNNPKTTMGMSAMPT